LPDIGGSHHLRRTNHGALRMKSWDRRSTPVVEQSDIASSNFRHSRQSDHRADDCCFSATQTRRRGCRDRSRRVAFCQWNLANGTGIIIALAITAGWISGLQKIVFDSAQLPGDDGMRREAWIETLAATVARLNVEPAPGVQFNGALEIVPLYGGAVCAVGATFSNLLHGAADIAIDGQDTVVMMISADPRPLQLTQQSRSIELAAGEAVLFDQTQWTNLAAQSTDMSRVIGIRAPRELLRQRLRHLEDRFFAAVPRQDGALSLLQAYVTALMTRQGPDDPVLAKLAMDHLADLVALTVGWSDPGEQSAGQRAARLITIQNHIDESFGDPRFSLTALARRMGISPRQIQRLLADSDTSFVDQLVKRRLRRAHDMLTSKLHADKSVIDIAQECGFSTVSHFHRVFRREFGATPRQVRGP